MMHRRLPNRLFLITPHIRQNIITILPRIPRQIHIANPGYGRQQIRQTHRLVATRPRFNHPRPRSNKRNAMPAIPRIGLLPPINVIPQMIVLLLQPYRLFMTTIITRHNNQRIIRQPIALNRRQNASNAPIVLRHIIPVFPRLASPCKSPARKMRRMRRRRWEIQKERLIPILLRVLIDKPLGANRQLQQTRIMHKPGRTRTPAPKFWPRRIRSLLNRLLHHHPILNITIRSHIQRRRNNKRIIKTHRMWSVRQRRRKIHRLSISPLSPISYLPTQPQMPLAHTSRRITLIAQQRWHSHPPIFNQRLRIPIQNPAL